jgi:Domain of unknown function (DUF4145)
MILYCFNCNARVHPTEKGNYIVDITDEEPDRIDRYGEEIRTYKKYTFLQCSNCSKPIIAYFVYDNDTDDYPDHDSEPLILYPTSNKIINSEVSNSIKNAFEEALLCFEIRAFTACVIMCRKTVEGICKENNIEKGNLKNKLEIMKNEGIIDQNLFDWADTLRLSGNDAAHDLDITFSWEDAQDIIDFTYAIVEYIFTYRKKFQQFKERKNNQVKPQNNLLPPPTPSPS